MVTMFRRLEDRIRELCYESLLARGPELEQILTDLKAALHEHAERLRNNAGIMLVRRENDVRPERRSA
jgi:hypothetical protein